MQPESDDALVAIFSIVWSQAAFGQAPETDEPPNTRVYMTCLAFDEPDRFRNAFSICATKAVSVTTSYSTIRISVGPVSTLTPGFGTVGGQVRQPLAILGFRVAYEAMVPLASSTNSSI